VKEDVPQVMAQLRWLKAVAETEKNITILVTQTTSCSIARRATGR
jgi:hypothetical protein